MNLLVVDIGNSDTVFGIWEPDNISPVVLRMETALIVQDPLIINQLLEQNKNSGLTEITKIVISSVVPKVTGVISEQVKKYSSNIKILDQSQFKHLPIQILKPEEIGTDLVANALGAFIPHQRNCIVVDFGTALSFTTIDQDGVILGVSIAPGLRTALKALTAHTAQLQSVPLFMPPSALGKNTEEAIQTGILYGYDGLVRGIIRAQEKELGIELFVIVTGGLSHRIPTLKDRVNLYAPNLTLQGLKIAASYL